MTRPSGATWSSVGIISATDSRVVTSKTAPRRLEAVSSGLKTRKFLDSSLRVHHVAEVLALDFGCFCYGCAGSWDRDGVVPEVGEAEIAEEEAAVGVGIGAHAEVAFGGEVGEFGEEPAGCVEEFFGAVALHPFFEHLDVLGIFGEA